MQRIVDKLKNDLLEFLPFYINYDLQLPDKYVIPFTIFDWTFNSLDITNFNYDMIYMDLK